MPDVHTLIVSSSLNPQSRSKRLAGIARNWLLAEGHDVELLDLSSSQMPRFDVESVFDSPAYQEAIQKITAAQALILASPVYNWSLCAELKNFVEAVGSTDSTRPTPLFDKLVSFIFAAGLPHSYMVLGSIALPLMLDFRCVINPNHAYLHNQHWTNEVLNETGSSKLQRMLITHVDLVQRLDGYKHTGSWVV
jgi:FMN reductase